jgi:hypothetical protein
MEKRTEKAYSGGKMVIITREISETISNMDREYSFMRMATNMMVNGKIM